MTTYQRRSCCAVGIAVGIALGAAQTTLQAAFHQWQVREIFTNASGSVQFIEMFDNFPNETAVSGFSISANSDGSIKTFTFPGNLTHVTPGSLLIATTGFGSLTGGVTPDFTFSQSTTPISGSFFNPNATNISISFNGSSDSMAVTGAALPKDGFRSLTDAGASAPAPNTPNISAGVNSPTNLNGTSGGINVSTGDYNGDHSVNAPDYIVWRKNPSAFGTNAAGYGAWRNNFGNPAPASGSIIPEPASIVCSLGGIMLLAMWLSRWRARRA